MVIKFRSKIICEVRSLDDLNDWIKESDYDILKNIHKLNIYSLDILESNKIMGIRVFLNTIPKFPTNNPKNINYWLERGWDNNDSIVKIKEIIELQSKGIMSKISKENRIINAKKANKARVKQIKELQQVGLYNKSNPTTLEYYMNRGLSNDAAKLALKERQSTFSKKKMIEKYGEAEGMKKVQERNEKWISSLKENNVWGVLSKKKAVTLEKMIFKYGEDVGTKKYHNWKQSAVQSKDNFIKRWGELGLEKYSNMLEKKAENTKTFTSKESIMCFQPILEILDSYHIDYFVGVENNKEYFLKDNSNIFFFDLTIPALNKIVEYNGVAFHPRKSWDKLKWDNWIMPFKNLSSEEKYKYDCYKNQVARNNGFEVLEVWSEDLVSEIRNQILLFLELSSL